MKFTLLFLCCLLAWGQTAPTTITTPAPTFSTGVVPTGIGVFGEFNQLGTQSKWSGGAMGIYPVSTSAGVYLTTVADFLPQKAIDPTTKKPFYAISAAIREGAHKTLIQSGKFAFLAGGDIGPSFANPSGTTGAISVSISTSFTLTGTYQFSSLFSLIVPLRMLYISGIGWNPVGEFGFVLNTKNLPKATTSAGRPTLAQMRKVMKRAVPEHVKDVK